MLTLNSTTLRNHPPNIRTAALLLLLLALLPLYYISYHHRLRHPYSSTSSHYDKDLEFTNTWLLAPHTSQPFNPSPLARYCSNTTTTTSSNNNLPRHTGLIFTLFDANGGIGNIRGNILDFIFFAIEAGASGIVLPRMAKRSEVDIANVWGDGDGVGGAGKSAVEFGEVFDEGWFVDAMARACPEVRVYRDLLALGGWREVPGRWAPRTRRVDLDAGNTREALRGDLEGWVGERGGFLLEGEEKGKGEGEGGGGGGVVAWAGGNKKRGLREEEEEEKKKEKKVLVNVGRTLWDFDTRSLPWGVRSEFGKVLRLNERARTMAALIVRNLSAKYGLQIDPRDVVPRAAFYGAHLRTESDAKAAGWMVGDGVDFDKQTDGYIAHALKNKLTMIYVASGNATDLARFRRKAAVHRPSLNVTSKFDLLPTSEAAKLRELSWDQQALVDYEVLLRCSVFGGIVKSSFSYNVAMTRQQWLEDQGRVSDPWAVQDREDGVSFDDGISRLLGRDLWHEQRIPRGMWP